MAARLKVFSFSNGFHAFTVATSSRGKALAAWGIEQDIFKDGLARQIDRGPDHDAALARPGEVIQRGEAVDAGAVKAARKPAKPRPNPSAKRIAVLEARVEALDLAHAAALDAIDADITGLTDRRRTMVQQHQDERAKAVKALKGARARAT